MIEFIKTAMIASRNSKVVLLPAKYPLHEAVKAFNEAKDIPEFKGDNFYIGLIMGVPGVRFLGNDYEIAKRRSEMDRKHFWASSVERYVEGVRDIEPVVLATGIPIYYLVKLFTMCIGDTIIIDGMNYPNFDVKAIQKNMPQIENRRHKYEHHDIFRKVRITRIK